MREKVESRSSEQQSIKPRPNATLAEINLDEVQASLDAVCPKSGALIPPADVRRIDFDRIECPACGERFVSGPIDR
jgi:hypothetical protein